MIREQVTYKEEEDEEDGKGGSDNGRAIGIRAKTGSNNLISDKNRGGLLNPGGNKAGGSIASNNFGSVPNN